jgi:hypothetical protein
MSGGSRALVPKRNRRNSSTSTLGSYERKKENIRAVLLRDVGEERLSQIRSDWAELNTGHGEGEWLCGDGILISPLREGWSQGELNVALGVGGYRINRNSTMRFTVLLCLLFYDKVVLLFLIPGHSHMIADRVVA